MTTDEQLARWLAGESIHNGADRDDGECCPDFSCCTPGLLAPDDERAAFAAAHEAGDQATVDRLLGDFLARMLRSHGFGVLTRGDATT